MWRRKGHIIPLLLELPKNFKFWEKVIQNISDMISIQLPVWPWVFILGILPPELRLSDANLKVNIHSFQAKLCIASTWKSSEAPTAGQRLLNHSNHLAMEKLTNGTKGKIQFLF